MSVLRRRRKRERRDASRWYPLVGTLAAVVLVVLVWISYHANSGVPGASYYELTVEVPNAERLVKTNQVRIAGVRSGQVARVSVVERSGAARRPYARIAVKLDERVPQSPADTVAKVRPASILGASYLDLVPGRSTRTVAEGGTLRLARARRSIELTDLLDVFDRSTSRSTQQAFTELGGGLAGRGQDLGTSISALKSAAGPVRQVAATLAAPETALASAIFAFDAFSGEVSDARRSLAGLTTSGATTFAAIDAQREDVARILHRFPKSAETTSDALRRLRPALTDLADISVRLRPAAARLPGGLDRATATFRSAIPTLRTIRPLSGVLRDTAGSLDAVSRLPQTTGGLRRLGDVLEASTPLVRTLADAQVHCNSISLFGRGFSTTYGSIGSGDGPSVANITIKSLGAGPLEALQNAAPLPNLHTNYNPKMNAQECEAGNEVYDSGRQVLSNPPGLQDDSTIATTIDPAVRERLRTAGLLAPPPGDR